MTTKKFTNSMEQIIDIAKQNLDTYRAEITALLYMNNEITKNDLRDAVRNMRKLSDEIEEML